MFFCVCILFRAHFAEQELSVSGSSGEDTETCGSPLHPCATIASAFLHAKFSSAVTIFVSDGVYKSESNICISSQTVTISCSSSVSIQTSSFELSTFLFSLTSGHLTVTNLTIELKY